MPVEDRFDDTLAASAPDVSGQDDLPGQQPYRVPTQRRPNAFGCLLLVTGVLFAILFVLGLRAYARVAASDIVSLAMIGFVGILALGQLVVGVWMLRGAPSNTGLP
jgi:hypothetical protein